MRNSKSRALEQAPFQRRKQTRAPPAPAVPPARLRHLARRVHALGERPLYELLLELQQGAPLEERLEAYAALDELAPFIREQGGDRLPIARLIRKPRGRP